MMSCAAAALLLASCEPPGKPKEKLVASEDITDFKTLFNENCSGCHGVNGRDGPGRPLNDPVYLALIPRETLQQTIENGRPGTAMPAWARSQGGPLYPKQVAALVDGIEKNWAKPLDLHGKTLPSYAVGNANGQVARGRKAFVMNCFMCHGKGAAVGPVTDSAFLALVSDQGLRTSIIVGRSDLGMPDWRVLNRGHALSDQDVADLVAFLSSLRPSYAATALVNESGSGQSGPTAKGNEGSGYGPGSPRQQSGEGNKQRGSSQRSLK